MRPGRGSPSRRSQTRRSRSNPRSPPHSLSAQLRPPPRPCPHLLPSVGPNGRFRGALLLRPAKFAVRRRRQRLDSSSTLTPQSRARQPGGEPRRVRRPDAFCARGVAGGPRGGHSRGTHGGVALPAGSCDSRGEPSRASLNVRPHALRLKHPRSLPSFDLLLAQIEAAPGLDVAETGAGEDCTARGRRLEHRTQAAARSLAARAEDPAAAAMGSARRKFDRMRAGRVARVESTDEARARQGVLLDPGARVATADRLTSGAGASTDVEALEAGGGGRESDAGSDPALWAVDWAAMEFACEF